MLKMMLNVELMILDEKTLKKNEILDLLFEFALELIKLVKYLKVNKELIIQNPTLKIHHPAQQIGAELYPKLIIND